MSRVKTCVWHEMSCTWVNFHVLHASYFLCACTWVIIRVMHNSNKHVSNASCAACESVLLCAACKSTAIFCQRRIKAYNEKAPPAKCDKTRGHEKIVFCQVFTYPYSRWHFHWINWMPNMIMAQGLDSTGTNNLTRLVAQCAHVLYHKAQGLKLRHWCTILDCRHDALSSQLVKKLSY